VISVKIVNVHMHFASFFRARVSDVLRRTL
jgi:hypothetical protein